MSFEDISHIMCTQCFGEESNNSICMHVYFFCGSSAFGGGSGLNS